MKWNLTIVVVLSIATAARAAEDPFGSTKSTSPITSDVAMTATAEPPPLLQIHGPLQAQQDMKLLKPAQSILDQPNVKRARKALEVSGETAGHVNNLLQLWWLINNWSISR